MTVGSGMLDSNANGDGEKGNAGDNKDIDGDKDEGGKDQGSKVEGGKDEKLGCTISTPDVAAPELRLLQFDYRERGFVGRFPQV